MNFADYVENICFLYQHKKNTQIYIKIINYMVQKEQDYRKFFDVFKPISDIIAVESLIDISEKIDYRNFSGQQINFAQTVSSSQIISTNICSMPFYTLLVRAEGSIYPCCDFRVTSIGNIEDGLSLKEIWKNQSYKFQRVMLNGRETIPCCSQCKSMKYLVRPEDCLDEKKEEIKRRYDRKKEVII